MRLIPKRMSSFQIIIVGFILLILIGAFLLMLPIASNTPNGASFEDALFTATSASCVTGLVVQDTGTYWTGFGHFIILFLIQIGGLGVVTIAVSIAYLSGKSIGLKQRSTLQDAVSAQQVGGIIKLTRFILILTFGTELLGTILLAPSFCKEFGFFTGLWYSLFHSVSAFCNAGFDLMGVKATFSSLTSYVSNPFVNSVIMLLIVIGGLGFLTWEDIVTHKFKLKRYRMQSKVIITVTLLLISLPALYFYFCEFNHENGITRVLSSLFQSVTARTAGFNTVDLSTLSETGFVLMITLMIIGGSPGSTAGGLKTTTFAVLVSTVFSVFKRKEHTVFFGRRIHDDAVKSASTLLVMYLFLFLVSGTIISKIEGLPLMSCLFETASAVGTVGVTVGITPELGIISRMILIALMFLGRVGGLTLIYAATSGRKSVSSKLPQEKITIG